MCPFGKGLPRSSQRMTTLNSGLSNLASARFGQQSPSADIVGGMRDHIKKALPRREPFDLNEAVSEVKIMVRSANARIELPVSAHLTNGPVPVRAFNCKKSS